LRERLGWGKYPTVNPRLRAHGFFAYSWRAMKHNRTARAGDPASARSGHGTNPPRRILMVEDDLTMRLLNTEVLSGSGYHVDTAEDGDVAWETLQRNRYDLMVTDNNMPKVSGVELVKKVRAARMALPIILVSGMMPTEELKQHPWLQIDALLAKPFSSSELVKKVEEVLSERKVIPFPLYAESCMADPIAAPTPDLTPQEGSWPDGYPGLFSYDEKPKTNPNWR